MRSSGAKRMSISFWPAVATSWWWTLHLDAGLHEREHDLRADVLQRVVRRKREVAFLVARLVTEIAAAERAFVTTGVPLALGGFDVVEAAVRVLAEADGVEDEELEFRTEVAGVCDPARGQMDFRLARNVARVPRVRLTQNRIDHVADERQRGPLAEGIDERRRAIGLEQHVGLMDLLEAANRRAVEADSVLEQPRSDFGQRDREVLPEPGKIGESEIDDLDLVPSISAVTSSTLCGRVYWN